RSAGKGPMARGPRSAALRFVGLPVRRAGGCAQRAKTRSRSLAGTFDHKQGLLTWRSLVDQPGQVSMRARMSTSDPRPHPGRQGGIRDLVEAGLMAPVLRFALIGQPVRSR